MARSRMEHLTRRRSGGLGGEFWFQCICQKAWQRLGLRKRYEKVWLAFSTPPLSGACLDRPRTTGRCTAVGHWSHGSSGSSFWDERQHQAVPTVAIHQLLISKLFDTIHIHSLSKHDLFTESHMLPEKVNATSKQLKPWQHAWRGVSQKAGPSGRCAILL